MADEFKYLVFRLYSKEEREDPDQRVILFGWSKNKNVIKAFLQQRDGKKYTYKKFYEDEIIERFSEDVTDSENMIDYIKLKSANSGEEILFFSTMKEMKEAESKIQTMFIEASKLDIDGSGNYLDMFCNLRDYYADALYYIGLRPPDLDILFPSSDEYTPEITIDNMVESAYEEEFFHPQEEIKHNRSILPGVSYMNNAYQKVIYSIESFIKVLRDDL